jgi:hypothetical protein
MDVRYYARWLRRRSVALKVKGASIRFSSSPTQKNARCQLVQIRGISMYTRSERPVAIVQKIPGGLQPCVSIVSINK